ncbi:MAG TPA: hypothetical protein VF272_01280 [Candidatus Saccharimonadia bacterium]
MATKQSPGSKKKHDDNFYETMPGGLYIDSNELFPGRFADEADYTDHAGQDEDRNQVRNRMMRQSLILVSLLVAQIVLFMLLITYTVNLG